MRKFILPTLLILAGHCVGVLACSGQDISSTNTNKQSNWPQWRGPLGTGEAPNANPPVSWSETENVRWKTQLPGKGHSTPVIWEDHIFVTAAVPFGDKLTPKYSGAPGAHDNLPVSQHHRFQVIAIDRNTGEILWQREANRGLPHEGGHFTASLASASPITDGQRVYAFFGTFGLFCYDFDGNLIWQKQFGRMNSKHGHGEGSSPVLYEDKLVVNWDHEGDSFIAAFDVHDGRQLWRNDRREVTSWASPITVTHNGRGQVIVAATDRVRGYDIESGEPIWECGGLSHNVCATPVAGDGMVYVGSSYDTRAIFGINLNGARGDITGTDKVVWLKRERTPYVPSLLLYEDQLYYLRHYQGILTRVVAKTGDEPAGPFRLRGLRDIYASPVAAKNRIYVTDRHGTTIVLSTDAVPRVMSLNRLDDRISASAAMVDKQFFLRGEQFLYCLADDQ